MPSKTPLKELMCTRTTLEGLRARGQNWQSIGTIYISMQNVSNIYNVDDMAKAIEKNHEKAIEKYLKETPETESGLTLFVLENENVFSIRTDDGPAIGHTFNLTPVQIYEPEEGQKGQHLSA